MTKFWDRKKERRRWKKKKEIEEDERDEVKGISQCTKRRKMLEKLHIS